MARRIKFSSPKATTLQVISKQLLVSLIRHQGRNQHTDDAADDVRDIYRRAEGEELVVEGLREGTDLVQEK